MISVYISIALAIFSVIISVIRDGQERMQWSIYAVCWMILAGVSNIILILKSLGVTL